LVREELRRIGGGDVGAAERVVEGGRTPDAAEPALRPWIALWMGTMAHIQDLRDIKGDAVVGRKTFPLVFGDERSRWIITFLLLPLAVFVLWGRRYCADCPGYGVRCAWLFRVARSAGERQSV